MKNTTIILGIVIIIALVAGFVYFNSASATGTTLSNSGQAQKIVLSMKNGNYYPNTITVKAGQPVQISLDSSIRGCYRSFTMRDFGIQKNLATPSDVVTFTPTQKGTYRFACSMGMGFGTLIVE